MYRYSCICISCMGYFSTLSLSQATWRRMTGRLVNDEFGSDLEWNGRDLITKGLRKSTKCPSQGSRFPGRDSNREPPECNCRALLFNPLHQHTHKPPKIMTRNMVKQMQKWFLIILLRNLTVLHIKLCRFYTHPFFLSLLYFSVINVSTILYVGPRGSLVGWDTMPQAEGRGFDFQWGN
jgi:hypothetical protein